MREAWKKQFSVYMLPAFFKSRSAARWRKLKHMKRNSLPGKYEGFGEPAYAGIKLESRYVTLHDGTRLALDIVRPAKADGTAAEGKFPAILLISRNGRFEDTNFTNGPDVIQHCVPYGYVGLVLELRGCGASFGTCTSFVTQQDRHDVTEVLNWVGQQVWSDGQCAIYGGSNRALIQFAAAVNKPAPSPVLKGITPVVANPDFYYQDYPNGVSAVPKMPAPPAGTAAPEGPVNKEERMKKVKPVQEDTNGDMAYQAYLEGQYGKNKNFMTWLLLDNMCRDDEHPHFGGEKTNITIPPITDIDVYKKSGIRLHQFAGEIESGIFGQLMAAKEWGGSIVAGPWDHFQSRRGNPDKPAGMFDFCAEHLKWFDNLLKGIDNGFDTRPPFFYYVENAKPDEEWRCSDSWPLETIRPMTLYLDPAKSGTVASVNDGTLSQFRPEETKTTDYRVDTSIQVFAEDGKATIDRMHLDWNGDMAPEVDSKGLTFTSAPLFRMYENEINGCVSVDLWVTCSQNDADFIAYLEEVLPNGESRYIANGCLRASHRTVQPRESWEECGAFYHPCLKEDQQKCLEQGMSDPVHLQFHIEPRAWVFGKGSRVRITVTCADKKSYQHPMYDEASLPTVQLYTGGDKASFVKIPFVEHCENVYNGNLQWEGYCGPATLYFFKNHTYIYYNGFWKKFDADAPEMRYVTKEGTACFAAGFRFTMEGGFIKDGIVQDYQGGEKPHPFPAHRHLYLDTVPVEARRDCLYAPDVKTLLLEVYDGYGEQKSKPCIVNIHGYGVSPALLRPDQLREFVQAGYTVAGIDLRAYPSNRFPDYVYDIKGGIRYLRAHAAQLGIDPEKIGCFGRSLGGNSTLMLGATAACPELEGHVGGNEGVSSRIQAMCVGFGWSDLLHMGADLTEEYKDFPESLRKRKYMNSDGPNAPLSQLIGFSGEGKGIGVLRDYMESGREGTEPAMDAMLEAARKASPVSYIGPDCAPAVIFGGTGMYFVDIPNRQTQRTFELCTKYGVECFCVMNTNGDYGLKPTVMSAIRTFFDSNLKNGPAYAKSVMTPGSKTIVEDAVDKTFAAAPLLQKNGKFYLSAEYLQHRLDLHEKEAFTEEGIAYVDAAVLEDTGYGLEYYADKNMAVLIPRSMLRPADSLDRA